MKPWLLSIVRNCHLTAVSQIPRMRNVPVPSDDEIGVEYQSLIGSDPDPEACLIATEHGFQLGQVLATLTPEYREILVLREVEDLSYREISQIIDAPIGTVMSRLARARSLLKKAWLSDAVRLTVAVH